MARRKTLPESVRAKQALADRLTALRGELYGERGGPELARQLGLPVRTWYNYEGGVTVPAEVILKIIELTSVEPMWLLHGRGPKFRHTADRPDVRSGSGMTVGSLLRTALQMLEQGEPASPTVIVSRSPCEVSAGDDPADVVLIAVDESGAGGPITAQSGPKFVAARSEWLDAERECRVIRMEGDSMAPIVADGAYVAFAKPEEDSESLDGRLVVAWVNGTAVVCWFQFCSRYAVLRAENPAANPTQTLVDLEGRDRDARFRRVLWINTPH